MDGFDQELLDDLRKVRPGWVGNYTTREAPGALPNGTRVVKVAEDPPGDRTRLGTPGTVLGSMTHVEKGICYFVEWDNKPKTAIAVIHWKVTALDGS